MGTTYQPFSRRRSFVAVIVATVLVLVLTQGPVGGQQQDPSFQPMRVLGPQPPIMKFPVKTVREVGTSLNPSELVLGVTIGTESRAYPINMLTGPQREILNDMVGDKAIAATW